MWERLFGIVIGAIVAVLGGVAFFDMVKRKEKKPPPFVLPIPEPIEEDLLPPNVYGFFSTQNPPYPWRGQVVLDMGYQVHGCDKQGFPSAIYGARSPSGRPLSYEWKVETGGTEDTVFDHNGVKLTGPTAQRLVVWFAGWKKEYPPYPVRVNPLSCPLPDDTPTEDIPKSNTLPVTITVIVRDDKGHSVTYREFSRAISGSCS